MTSVPFLDLKRQYLLIKDEVDAAVQGVFERGDFILGAGVADFEKKFAAFCGVQHCVAVNAGTAALTLALRALRIGPGDEVLLPANTFIATAEAVIHVGATPVLVETDPETYLIDLADAARRVTDKTKVIIPVHLYGQLADMAAVTKFAEERGLQVIEDACQAAGATQHGKQPGSFGVLTAFSFYPGKNLGAYGEGGAIVTNDAALAEEMRALRNHGCHVKYVHESIGYNMRMEGLQGAVLGVKLPHLNNWNAARNRIAARYREGLAGVGDISFSKILEGNVSNYHLFVIQTARRDELAQFLHGKGVSTGIHYPIPIHLQQAFVGYGYAAGDFPVTESGCARILSLPIFPELTDEELEYTISSVKEFFVQ